MTRRTDNSAQRLRRQTSAAAAAVQEASPRQASETNTPPDSREPSGERQNSDSGVLTQTATTDGTGEEPPLPELVESSGDELEPLEDATASEEGEAVASPASNRRRKLRRHQHQHQPYNPQLMVSSDGEEEGWGGAAEDGEGLEEDSYGSDASSHRSTCALRNVLPLPKAYTPAPIAPTPIPPENGGVEPDMPRAGNTSTADPSESESEAMEANRIGEFFGYNGSDAMVPKPAYEAALQRVATLEGALGSANRDMRANATAIAESQVVVQQLSQQVAQGKLQVKALEDRLAAMIARETELEQRENAVEAAAKQQRKLLRKRFGEEGDWVCPHCVKPLRPPSKDEVGTPSQRRRGGRRDESGEVDSGNEGMLPKIPGASRAPSDYSVGRSNTAMGFFAREHGV